LLWYIRREPIYWDAAETNWWLRSPGDNDNNAANVNNDGEVNGGGGNNNNVDNERAVRPD
jgi:hypothetical protein